MRLRNESENQPQLIIAQDAIAALNTLQSNFSVVDAIRKSGKSLNKQAIPEMIEWCRRIGYEVCRKTHSEGLGD